MAYYITWANDAEKLSAMEVAGRAMEKALGANTYRNAAPNVSVREPFDRSDYESFRPDDALPTTHKGTLQACMDAYDQVGIVRNVIDLMSDFASQGIELTHPNPRVERFYREWFRRVGGPERTERFLNTLYRCGNVVVMRRTAKLRARDEPRFRRGLAADGEMAPPPDVARREVPWRYHFLNPMSVDLLAAPLATLLGKDHFRFALRVPGDVARLVRAPSSDAERAAVAALPEAVRQALQAPNANSVPLDPERTRAFYYKRDDWRPWATPLLKPILPDLQMLKKMKLADLSALDGAISCIRVWKLGSLEHQVMPAEALVVRLAEMLTNRDSGGVVDLIWGPDIELLETNTELHRFLGDAKYGPVLTAIYQGLGVPLSLSGTSSPGLNNNVVSLRTLIERLEYGRSVVREMWEHEVRLVQRAMGFRFPAHVNFDRVLTDEAAERQLLLNMADRELISVETLQERLGLTPEVEEVRLRREERRRRAGLLPQKAGPFHDAMFEQSLRKLFAGTGAYAPSELGIELEERRSGERSPAELQGELAPKRPADEKTGGQPGQGRPRNTKDSGPRKERTVKTRTRAAIAGCFAWAEAALAEVGRLTAPAYQQATGKASLRELSDAEESSFESFKFAVLCSLPPYTEVNAAAVGAALQSPLPVPVPVVNLVRQGSARVRGTEAMRRLRAAAYALYFAPGVSTAEGEHECPSSP